MFSLNLLIFDLIFSIGNFSPIVPVDANSSSSDLIFTGFSSSLICFVESFSANKFAIVLIFLKPSFPVKQFAFLVLIKTPFTFLGFILTFHLIFSDIIFDCVYTEA